ncbi:MAG: EAL domain-containing protein [Clostridia bacterium]|nr:EAL domain-containing protein [Clostridia bacterium]
MTKGLTIMAAEMNEKPVNDMNGLSGNADAYTACEYGMDADKLLFLSGGLLTRFGLKLPERFEDLRTAAEKWPLDESCREKAMKLFAGPRDPAAAARSFSLTLRPGGERITLNAFICRRENGENTLHMLFTGANGEESGADQPDPARYDALTGLLSRKAFCADANAILRRCRENGEKCSYIVGYFDIIRFKVINDMFGSETGDQLLKAAGDAISAELGSTGFGCREGADRFYLMMRMNLFDAGKALLGIFGRAAAYDLPFEIRLSGGLCPADDPLLSAEDFAERAILAQTTVKHDLSKPFAIYDNSMRDTLLTEHEIISSLPAAMERKQLRVAYQPQYNHRTGCMVGAEALARWEHPRFGAISPNTFIPIIEKNGLITKLDLYVFETVCAFLRQRIDDGRQIVPISVNVARYDIYQPDFVDKLEEIRARYDVPAELLRVEITESSIIGSAQHINRVIDQLHGYGFLVEMDDFGSGYSSLNVLGRVRFDVLKLDMRFISEQEQDRSDIVLSCVVRMAKWLGLPVIAEGVEKISQAEYLRSIGCDIIQGFLYSEAITGERFRDLTAASETRIGRMPANRLPADDGRNKDKMPVEKLIFNDYVGAAAVFCRKRDTGRVELLRVNQQYLNELRMNMSEKDILRMDAMGVFDDEDRALYEETMKLAEETDEERECVTLRRLRSDCCKEERIWLRSGIRKVWKTEDETVYFARVRNITDEKQREAMLNSNEKRFKIASEQANIYYWEYDIATREMRPCFRCMRDLGLPAVVYQYPEPVIESGLIQPEDAERYREWIRQLEKGVGTLEGEFRLTPGKIPFMFRYTTEFDAAGYPVKAFGSATMIR